MMDASNAKTSWSFPLQEMMVGSLRTPVGGLIARPWFDQVALQVLARWFFPLSRLWAAARAADGSIERYCAEAPMEPAPWLRSMLEPRLKRFETARNGVVDMEDLWEEAFWGRDTPSDETLKEIEHARLFRRNGYNALRRIFIPLKLRGAVTPIQWNTPTPSEVEAIYGRFADDPEAAFRPPEIMPEIVKSRVIETETRRDYWLRFTSPSARMNDQTIARVYEPKGVENPPTIILGHGICVEFDHWRGLTDEAQALAEMGNRVIRPEAPWHGRRVPPGRYGGEQFVATAPLGALDLFTSAVQEWAVLMHWCRQTTTGPVGIGGTSLGAMTAQLVADKSRYWPQPLHPDALLLITHCGRIEDAVGKGSLARVWGIAERTEAVGWTEDLIARYAPLIDPIELPVMPPETIVSVLGSHDDVTPFDSGQALVDRWAIPEENRFVWRCGHFSVPLAMLRDHRPLSRFSEILNGL
ncbi:MAG: alpha/beta hydrolase [Hyphomicrobiales bacterium]